MPHVAPWAFIGLFAGIWKLAVVAAAVGLFVWRRGLWRHPLWRLVRPWAVRPPEPVARARASTRASRDPEPSPAPAARGFWAKVASDRWYLLLAITVGLTLLAWVVARITIHHATG